MQTPTPIADRPSDEDTDDTKPTTFSETGWRRRCDEVVVVVVVVVRGVVSAEGDLDAASPGRATLDGDSRLFRSGRRHTNESVNDDSSEKPIIFIFIIIVVVVSGFDDFDVVAA